MKKWFLSIITALSCSVFYGDEPQKVETLSSKVILKNKDGYFVLSDGSFWKAIHFSKRWRTPREWWNDVQLIPENYECTPNDWYLGSHIEIYSKHGNLDVDETNAANQETLKQCTHLLVNARTGQLLFAIALEPVDCILQLFNDAYKEGYDEGYYRGKQRGYCSGYQDGVRKAKPESNSIFLEDAFKL